MSIEDSVRRRLAEINSQQDNLEQREKEQALQNARILFQWIFDEIVDRIAKTGSNSVSGGINVTMGFDDARSYADQIIHDLFSVKHHEQSTSSFWGNRKTQVTYQIIKRSPQEFSTFFSEFYRLTKSERIQVSWVIKNDKDYPRPFDPLTFDEYSFSDMYGDMGRNGPYMLNVFIEMQYSYRR